MAVAYSAVTGLSGVTDWSLGKTRSSADADNRLDAFTITGAPVNTTVTYNEAIFVTEH